MTNSSMVSLDIYLKDEGAALSVFLIYISVEFWQTDWRSILRFGMPCKIQKYKERNGATSQGAREKREFFPLFLERV